MIAKKGKRRHALMLLEITLVAFLGWTVLTSDRIASASTQNDKSLTKRSATVEGIAQSVSENLLATNGTFNACVQDDSGGSVLFYNSTTGQYQFDNCQGTIVSGTGTLTVMGSTTTLQDNRPDRRVLVRIDGALKRATVSVQLYSPSKLFTITDRNTTNNTCACT